MRPEQAVYNNVGQKDDIEKDLAELPGKIKEAEKNWGLKELEREQIEATLHMELKGSDRNMTVADLKAAIHSNGKRYQARINEITSKAEYNFLYEKLMSAKKLAGLRTAY